MSSIQIVEEWLYSDETMGDEGTPQSDIEEVLEHAKKSDDYIRLMYQIIGFMFKDASTAMQQGRLEKYRELPLDDVFQRVADVLELPMPLDMAPKLEDIPDAANDLPSIIQLN